MLTTFQRKVLINASKQQRGYAGAADLKVCMFFLLIMIKKIFKLILKSETKTKDCLTNW